MEKNNCEHKRMMISNDGNRTQKCFDCGHHFVKDGVVLDKEIRKVRHEYGPVN